MFKRVMCKISVPIESFSKLANHLDENKDGKITLYEFYLVVKFLYKEFKKGDKRE